MIAFHTLTFFFLLLSTFLNPTIAATNSICPDPGIKLLRSCAAACIGCVDARRDQLAYFLGCGDLPPNECYCRTDLFERAKEGLSSCISNACTLGPWAADATDAVRFYTRYCEKAGFTVAAQATKTGDTATVTGASGTGVKQTSVTSVEKTSTTPSVTSDTKSNSNSNSQVTSTIAAAGGSTGSTLSSGSKGMSSNNPIALGVGFGVGLPATVAAMVTCAVVLRKHWAQQR